MTDNFPRKLTDNEINDICNVLPKFLSSTKRVGEVAREEIIKLLKSLLENINLSPLAIPKFKENILQQYNRAIIFKGAPVGMHAAEAIGAKVQQETLNAVHVAGQYTEFRSSKERIDELIKKNTDNPKYPSMEIFFKDHNLTYEDIYFKKRIDIIEVTLGQLCTDDIEIETPFNLNPNGEPYWYSIYSLINPELIINKEVEWVCRIKLDKVLLYDFKISLYKIAEIINKNKKLNVKCIPSPFNDCFIDIFLIEENINYNYQDKCIVLTKSNEQLTFLQNNFIPQLDKIIILDGIKNIKDVIPVSIKVWETLYYSEKKIDKNEWVITLDSKFKFFRIPIEKVYSLLDTLNIKYKPFNQITNTITVFTPNDLSPNTYIKNKIREDDDEGIEYEIKMKEKKSKIQIRPPTKLNISNNYFYAKTSGTNLRDMLLRDDLDKSKCYSNIPKEMFNIFGKESSRLTILKEILLTLQFTHDDIKFNTRHLLFFIDYLTYSGVILAASHYGMIKQKKGYLKDASYQRQLDIFINNAIRGEKDKVSDISSSLYVGNKPQIGKYAFETKAEVVKRYDIESRKKVLLEADDVKLQDVDNSIDNLGFQSWVGENLINDISEYDENLNEEVEDETAYVSYISNDNDEEDEKKNVNPIEVDININQIENNNIIISDALNKTFNKTILIDSKNFKQLPKNIIKDELLCNEIKMKEDNSMINKLPKLQELELDMSVKKTVVNTKKPKQLKTNIIDLDEVGEI